MAPGCEPTTVSHMLAALRPHMYGASMAGAGGGGFMYLLMKEGQGQGDADSHAFQKVKDILAKVEVIITNLNSIKYHPSPLPAINDKSAISIS